MNRFKHAFLLTGLALLTISAGCQRQTPAGSLVITQIPVGPQSKDSARNILDQRYPPGSRVVLATPPFDPASVRVLSRGLIAAGGAVVCPSATRVLFAGKAEESSSWQIYEAPLNGGRSKPLTAIEGGAMDPAIMASGSLVFSSPVPPAGATWKTNRPPALYVQAGKGKHHQITFGTSATVEPTVLADGRILFVSARPSGAACEPTPSLGLFTVNNDGTEVTAFALNKDGSPAVHRPRELPDGRVAFLSADSEQALAFQAETVRSARPFASRKGLAAVAGKTCRSVESGGNDTLLVSTVIGSQRGGSVSTYAIHRVGAHPAKLGESLFDDPAWDDVEASILEPRPMPIGHISAMTPGKATGSILCLDANFTRAGTNGASSAKAKRVRILVPGSDGQSRVLGEALVQNDGSFLVETPADTPFGFETLDDQGVVLHRLEPSLWVRPGETRTCIGCHEPYNRSPRNRRPLAVAEPAVALSQPANMRTAEAQ